MTDPIRKITLSGGRTRYRCVLDIGRDPATGKRKQATTTVDTLREARAWVSTTRVEVGKGTFVARDPMTLAEYLPAWLAGRRDLKPSTRCNYADALKIPTAVLGARTLQELSKADVDRMVAGMLDGSLRSVGRKGTPMSGSTVRLVLAVLSQAFQSAVQEGRLARNVVTLVKRPADPGKRRSVWESDDNARFIACADRDRLSGAWWLSLHGLRRGEVLGLSWADLDLDAGTLLVRSSRVMVGAAAVLQSSTKSTAGTRTVPLVPDALTSLRRMRAQQAQERLAAGPAYNDSGLVVVDVLGRPVTPRWYSDRFQTLSLEARVPIVRLHDARHAFGSYLLDQGVSLPLVSQVMGHANVRITAEVYAHPLQAGADDRVRSALVAAGMRRA